MFRPMPVDHPEELVSIGTGARSARADSAWRVVPSTCRTIGRSVRAFVDLAGLHRRGWLGSQSTTRPSASRCTAVTDNYFTLLGVQPAIGRLIQPNEGRARGDAPVIVLTHEYWQARFGGDPSIVGRAVRLNGQPFTVIGVTPQSFDRAHSLIQPSAYVPLWMHDDLANAPASVSILESRDSHQMWVLGRLNPGVSLSQARAALEVKAAALAREYPATNLASPWSSFPKHTHDRTRTSVPFSVWPRRPLRRWRRCCCSSPAPTSPIS